MGSQRKRSGTKPSRPERRAQLLDDAVAAIREHGAGASMEQLAAAGGVTKPILYRHFGDRDGLVHAVGERYATELLARIGSTLEFDDPRALLREAVDGYLRFLEDDPELYSFLVRQTSVRPHADRDDFSLTDIVGRQVAVVVGDQLRAAGLDAGGAEPIGFGIVGLVHMAGDWWIRSRTMSRDALTTYLTDLLWDGFAGQAQLQTAGAGGGATPAVD